MEVYAARNGVIVVENPVKLRILHALSKSPATFDSIVSLVGRAKATVSVHLADMKTDGLISEASFDGDRRKKLFRMSASLVGASKGTNPLVRSFVKKELSSSVGDPFSFMSSLFRTVRYSLESVGLDTDAAVRSAGIEVGLEISKAFSSRSTEGLARETSDFWKRHRLGKMSVSGRSPLTLVVRECVGTKNSPDFGKPMCALAEGILESIFTARLGKGCRVKETECFGMGYPHCKFVITFSGEAL